MLYQFRKIPIRLKVFHTNLFMYQSFKHLYYFSIWLFMSDKKQSFRFRLPWGTAAQPRVNRPAAPQAPRPTVRTQPTPPAPTVSKATASQAKVEPDSSPPPAADAEHRANFWIASPARATKSQAASLPTSQSKAASLSSSGKAGQVQPVSGKTSQTRSPTRLESQMAVKMLPESSSPSRVVTEVHSPAQATILQPSLPKKSPAKNVLPLLSDSRQGQKQTASQKLSQELQPIGKLVSETHPQPEEVATTQPAEEAPTRAQNMDPNAVVVDHPSAGIGSGTQIKAMQRASFQAEQKSQEVPKNINKKETITGLNSDNEHISTMNSIHQKSVRSNGEQAPLHKEMKDDISKFVHKLASGHTKDDENSVTVITLAGENRGATMQIGTEAAKKDGSIPIHRGYKINQDEGTQAHTDGEESSKWRMPKERMTEKEPTKAYVNSNIQSTNNSIVFNSSVTERDPGVHMNHSHIPTELIKSNTKPATLKTHKAEVSITPGEKLTYKPTVRRRCLRGLFMESSDSDPENPQKPRRHGCRYACREMGKD